MKFPGMKRWHHPGLGYLVGWSYPNPRFLNFLKHKLEKLPVAVVTILSIFHFENIPEVWEANTSTKCEKNMKKTTHNKQKNQWYVIIYHYFFWNSLQNTAPSRSQSSWKHRFYISRRSKTLSSAARCVLENEFQRRLQDAPKHQSITPEKTWHFPPQSFTPLFFGREFLRLPMKKLHLKRPSAQGTTS